MDRLAARMVALATLVCALAAGTLAWAEAPASITTEGILHAKGGGPVADGDYTLTFRIYRAKSGGAALWTEAAKVPITKGEFHHVLGSLKPLAAATIAAHKLVWLGIQVGGDPELPRVQLHSVAHALVAQWAKAADTARSAHSAKSADTAKTADTAKEATTAKSAETAKTAATAKSADIAKDLQCTGCVAVAEMKFDGDIDLGKHKLTADSVVAKTIAANSFVGDGSKLTGIQKVSGSCSGAGEVVKGIDKDGKLVCVKAMDPTNLPKDGLDEISNGQLSAEFTDSDSISKVAPIPDNNPSGVSASIDVPDRGIAKKVTVSVEITNSDFKKLSATLTDPKGAKHVLFNDGGKPAGGVLKATYPAPTKPVSGDLTSWHGNNPKGKWTLTVIDGDYKDNKTDGEIKAFRIDVLTLSNKKVQATGDLHVQGDAYVNGTVNGFVQVKSANAPPKKCDATTAGFMYFHPGNSVLYICNGKLFYPLALTQPGTQGNPGLSCANLKTLLAADAKDGTYWIDPDGPGGANPTETYCDMTTDGGGWTLVLRVSNHDGSINFKQQGAGWQSKGFRKISDVSLTNLKAGNDFVSPAYDTLVANDVMVRERLGTDLKHSVRTKNKPLGGKTLRSIISQSIVDGGRACSCSITYGPGTPKHNGYDCLVFAGDESGDTEGARIGLRTKCNGDAESMMLGYSRSGHGDNEVFSQSNHWSGLSSVFVFVR